MDQKGKGDHSKKGSKRQQYKGRGRGKPRPTQAPTPTLSPETPPDPTGNHSVDIISAKSLIVSFGPFLDPEPGSSTSGNGKADPGIPQGSKAAEPEKLIPVEEAPMTSDVGHVEGATSGPLPVPIASDAPTPSYSEPKEIVPVTAMLPPVSEVDPADPPPPPPRSLVLEMPERSNEPPLQDPNFLTTPNTAEAELDHGHSFSYPKSESGSMGVSGRNRRMSGIRGDERTRRISIGIGGVPKKGYWGGMDDSGDSDDSLLAQTSNKRRKSSTFILGPKLMGYNRRQWLILIVIAMVDFCSAVLISIQAPMYPPEAATRGITPTTYGILFGVFELTIFLMSPTFFNLVSHLSNHQLSSHSLFAGTMLTPRISDVATESGHESNVQLWNSNNRHFCHPIQVISESSILVSIINNSDFHFVITVSWIGLKTNLSSLSVLLSCGSWRPLGTLPYLLQPMQSSRSNFRIQWLTLL